MGFIADVFSDDKGSGFEAKGADLLQGVDPSQTNQLYNQGQSGINQQQLFLQQLAAQNGIGNQSNVFGQQQGLANQLGDLAQGIGPNPAQAMLDQATGQNVANQQALMASQRGASANAGLIARQAAMQGAGIQQNSAGQAATMQAQQMIAAQQALQRQQAMMSGLASQQVAQQQGGVTGLNQAIQNQYGLSQDALAKQNAARVAMQSNMNTANAGIAQENTKGQQGFVGGLFNGAGAAIGAMHNGGMVKGYADGGTVPDGSSIEDMGPQSFAGKFLQGLGDPGEGQKQKTGADQMKEGGASLGAGMAKAGMMMLAASGGGKVPGQAPMAGDSLKNDKVPAMLSPGEVVIPRSVMQSKDPAREAAKFVAAILAQNMRKKK